MSSRRLLAQACNYPQPAARRHYDTPKRYHLEVIVKSRPNLCRARDLCAVGSAQTTRVNDVLVRIPLLVSPHPKNAIGTRRPIL